MAIQVLFFGELGEIAGESVSMSVNGGLHDLEQAVLQQFPKLSGKKYALSVNEETAIESLPLKDGDVVAFLPPFSGG